LPDKEQNPNHFSDAALLYSPGKRKWPGERKLLVRIIIKMLPDKKVRRNYRLLVAQFAPDVVVQNHRPPHETSSIPLPLLTKKKRHPEIRPPATW